MESDLSALRKQLDTNMSTVKSLETSWKTQLKEEGDKTRSLVECRDKDVEANSKKLENTARQLETVGKQWDTAKTELESKLAQVTHQLESFAAPVRVQHSSSGQ